jgi:hypothetical protein
METVGTHAEEIIWEEPPPAKKGPNSDIWMRVLAPLLDHPGKWARVREVSTVNQGVVSTLRTRKSRIPRPDHKWEFTSRRMNGSCFIYARYLGEGTAGE